MKNTGKKKAFFQQKKGKKRVKFAISKKKTGDVMLFF